MNVLSIQSQVVYGHVGNSAAAFVLQRQGHAVWQVPTVLFSNHLGKPTFRGRDVPAEQARDLIQGLSAYHSLYYSQGRAGYLPTSKNEQGRYELYGYHDGEPSLRPLVKIHPETGRPNLVIGRHAYGIPGLDPDESERLLDRLNEQACQPPRVHYHRWEVGDAVVWDNRRLMHQATPFDLTEPRVMWHTRIAGDRPSELAINLD